MGSTATNDTSKREIWRVRNTTNKLLTIGDLSNIPTFSPGDIQDLLRFHTKNQIEQSSDLKSLLDTGWLTLVKIKDTSSKRLTRTTAKTAVLSAEEDEISDSLSSINNLNDVTTGTPNNGAYLIWDNNNSRWTSSTHKTVWDDLRVPVTSLQTGASNPPSFLQLLDDGAASVGVFTYKFSQQGVAGNEEQMWFVAQLSHGYKIGTNISPHLHWCADSDEVNKVVRWGFEYTWSNINGTFGNTTIIYANDDTNNDSFLHHIVGFADIGGPSGTNTVSSMLLCRVFRNSSAGADTYTGNACLLEFDFHYEIDTIGSNQKTAK